MIEKGLNYLIYESKPDKTFRLFKEILESDKEMEGLCLTTVYPKKLKKLYNIEKTKIMWLSDSKSDDMAVSPARVDFEIARSLKKFIKNKGEKGVLLLDGFEYLLLANDFDKIRKFIKSLSDLASMNELTFIVTINPQSFNKETATTLSRDFDKVGEAAEFYGDAKPASAPPPAPSTSAPATPPPAPAPPPSRPQSVPQPVAPPASAPAYTPPPMSPPPGVDSSGKELEIEDMYLIHRATGILIQRKTWRQSDLIDPDLISGMLRAILDFVNDSFSSGDSSSFSRFEIKGYIIFLYDGAQVSLATVLSGEQEAALVKHLKTVKKVVQESIVRMESEYMS
ncbi:MAG: DUF835 domain-containing protein, partial [Thermoplasmata archaeon]|nr:DUF835 domain-containing protein [Thermoplasmata archaeon]